jgi:glycosyltransferase involved in cell wall biosynthesis
MKHIAFVIPTLTGGGAERVIVTLVKYLDRRRFRVTLAVVDTRDAVLRGEIPDDVEFIDLGARRVRHALPRIIRTIWRIRPDVLFSTLGHLNVALAMVRFLLPRSVWTGARRRCYQPNSLQVQPHRAAWKPSISLVLPQARRGDLPVALLCATTWSEFRFPEARSRIIHSPVDVDRVRSLSAQRVGVSGRRFNVVSLVAAGRLDKEKGFDLLIEALALLDRPAVSLILLGQGPLKSDLQECARRQGVADRVHFVGFQSNPFAWFARADAFVLSSHYEGFPNVVLESLACGTPVISTPAPGGTREILDGVEGCVMAEEVSARSLADAIKRWLDGPRRRVVENAVDSYRVERILGEWRKLRCGREAASLRSCVNEHPGRYSPVATGLSTGGARK